MNTFPCHFNFAISRWNLIFGALDFFFNSMSTLKSKRNFAGVNTKSQEKHPRINFLRDTNASRFKEEYITEASNEIERRVTEKTSQEISRTKSRILGSLSKLDVYGIVRRSCRTVNSEPDVVLHVFGYNKFWLCIPCVIHAELSDLFPSWNEWLKVAKVSIGTLILKTKTQNEVKNAEMQNVFQFDRLKECCWEVSVIKSICQIFCNRLRSFNFARTNVGITP